MIDEGAKVMIGDLLDKDGQAKRDWKQGRFPKVPGDQGEYISLPA